MDPYGKVPGRPEGAGPDRDAEDGRDSDTRGKGSAIGWEREEGEKSLVARPEGGRSRSPGLIDAPVRAARHCSPGKRTFPSPAALVLHLELSGPNLHG